LNTLLLREKLGRLIVLRRHTLLRECALWLVITGLNNLDRGTSGGGCLRLAGIVQELGPARGSDEWLLNLTALWLILDDRGFFSVLQEFA